MKIATRCCQSVLHTIYMCMSPTLLRWVHRKYRKKSTTMYLCCHCNHLYFTIHHSMNSFVCLAQKFYICVLDVCNSTKHSNARHWINDDIKQAQIRWAFGCLFSLIFSSKFAWFFLNFFYSIIKSLIVWNRNPFTKGQLWVERLHILCYSLNYYVYLQFSFVFSSLCHW